ncbi:transcriptional regulator, TetR family [Marinobacter daqiaonensis]|uniref:Transcriptional regulator, TetR family n=1 Tax=Marinobacter daqiaonensis TaxID=650891 RepID=A0A1I6JBT4_9GAMM|nr:TetR/AcrR family transcriptional regulator [Marinobacter daqiaonensis]SFR76391.1 transcriptional regulator, TetR family [Marinobacter daqiaonensis]
MPASSLQTQQNDQNPKRLAILEAALEQFAELGVNGVAVPDIAARARVGTGTIYRYFQNKEALVNALYQEEKQRLERCLTGESGDESDPRRLFHGLWLRMVGFAREHPRSFRFLELQYHLPYLDRSSREMEHRILKRQADVCRYLQDMGIFRADMRAEIIMATVWGAFVNLMKAERAGYTRLTEEDINSARDGCWRLCASSAA